MKVSLLLSSPVWGIHVSVTIFSYYAKEYCCNVTRIAVRVAFSYKSFCKMFTERTSRCILVPSFALKLFQDLEADKPNAVAASWELIEAAF